MANTPTTLVNIQLIAKDDAGIQALSGSDPEVVLVLADVALHIIDSVWGTMQEMAQRYLAAHFLSLANQPVGGRGPLSSYSIGGISRTFTLPYLNQKTVLGSTQYGLMFMELRDMTIPKFVVIIPGDTEADNLP